MKVYEIMYILDQDLKDVEVLKDKLNSILLRDGGTIEQSEDWGSRKFEYPINKKSKGFYFVLIAKTSAANIDEFKRIARIESDVVRTFVLNTEKEEHYEASTKLSKTEVKNDRFDKKPMGRRYERRTEESNNENGEAATKNMEERAAVKPAVEE